MKVLYFFESIRFPFLDGLMSILTKLGEETVFIALAILIFWCFDKQKGYFLIMVGFLGTFINQFLKMLFRVPRPWVKDPNFTIVESAREHATGYSFPSGHTQSAVGNFGAIALSTKTKWVRILCIVLAVLVPITRLYLGVHTLLDVSVSILVALALIFGLYPLILKSEKNPIIMPILLGCSLLFGVFVLLFLTLNNFPSDVDANNLESSIENVSKLVGAFFGVVISYFIEKKYIKFDTKAPILVQVVKMAVGLGLIVLVKAVIKTPLNAVFGLVFGNGLRYFIIIILGVIVWPLTFKPLTKLYNRIFNK